MKIMERLLEQADATMYFYNMFTFFEQQEAVLFDEYFKDKNFQFVQVYNFSKVTKSGMTIMYRGTFSWKNNEIVSLDGNPYNKKMNLCGFCKLNAAKNNAEILYIIATDVIDENSSPEDISVYSMKDVIGFSIEEIEEFEPEEKSQD